MTTMLLRRRPSNDLRSE